MPNYHLAIRPTFPNLMNGNSATVLSPNCRSAIQTQTQTELEAYRTHIVSTWLSSNFFRFAGCSHVFCQACSGCEWYIVIGGFQRFLQVLADISNIGRIIEITILPIFTTRLFPQNRLKNLSILHPLSVNRGPILFTLYVSGCFARNTKNSAQAPTVS